MQTEVPTLPVVHLNVHKDLNRQQNPDLRSSSVERKIRASCKSIACLSSNKKCLHPLLGGPYRSNVRQQSLPEHLKVNKNSIGQRVLSAKMLRVKELQNQLADAHYHLNELANENRLLKALQKRQDSALKRYEGTNAELPRIINSHHEELRVLQIKYKKLKALHKETCDILKEKENELQFIQSQNKHLLQLSKDRHLGEREKLQLQVSDLNHRIEQQQETIQVLHRKLALESKSLKHQLQLEASKRKETQKNLEEATEKLKCLENLLDNRERRLFCNGQLLVSNKTTRLGTQSLTNLRDVSMSNSLKLSDRDKKWQEEKQSLPVLNASECNEDEDVKTSRLNFSQTPETVQTETMANLQQVKKYRIQKSSRTPRSSLSDKLHEQSKELECKVSDSLKVLHFEKSTKLGEQDEESSNQYDIEADEFRRIFRNRKYQNFNELSKEYKSKHDHSTQDTDSDNDRKTVPDNLYIDVAKNSRELHTRLICSPDENSDSKDTAFSTRKYTNKLRFSEQYDEDHCYESDSELESEIRKQLYAGNLPGIQQHDTSKSNSNKHEGHNYYKSDEEFEKSVDSNAHRTSDEAGLFNEAKFCQNLYNEMQIRNDRVLDDNYHNFRSSMVKEMTDNAVESEIDNLKYDTADNEQEIDVKKYTFNPSMLDEERYNSISTKIFEEDNPLTRSSSTEEYMQLEKQLKIFKEAEHSKVVEPEMYKYERTNNFEEIHDSIKDVKNESENSDQRKDEGGKIIENDIETKNKINREDISNELEQVNTLSGKVQSHESNGTHYTLNNVTATNGISGRAKIINYNKERLLATIKAIDDNENIEFLNTDYKKHNMPSRKQVTENLYHGIATQVKRKQDIIKHIFEND